MRVTIELIYYTFYLLLIRSNYRYITIYYYIYENLTASLINSESKTCGGLDMSYKTMIYITKLNFIHNYLLKLHDNIFIYTN